MHISASLAGPAHEPGRFHWDLMLQGHCAAMTIGKVLKTSHLQNANVWTLQTTFMPLVADSSFVASSMESDQMVIAWRHRSIFWLTKYWKQVLQHCQPIFTSFHACMHGGQRPKQTTIASDVPELMELEATCDGQHAHLPWGRTEKGYATAEETEYPFELCRRWAKIIADVILQDHQPQPNFFVGTPRQESQGLGQQADQKVLDVYA